MRSHELPPAGPADHLAINEDRSSSNNRSCDPPNKFAAEIGADATASLQGVRVERPPSLGIYNREVSVGTDGTNRCNEAISALFPTFAWSMR